MTAPDSPPPKFVQCPGCAERLGVRDQDVGRKARCKACGLVFVIYNATTAAPPEASTQRAELPPLPPAPPGSPPQDPAPQTVTFECSLCQTRITMRVTNVGKKVKCPDCGRKNVIPPPPPPKVVKTPAAFSGEQLGLWGVDERTWDAAAVAAAPALHPVSCVLCQTLMYATDAQIGSALRCPDCGTTTVAQRAAPKRPAGILPPPPGAEYQLDPASAPTPRYVPVPVAVREAEMHAAARALTVDRKGKLVKSPDVMPHGRPVRPAAPLITGVWRMLATEEVFVRWILISILFGGAAWFIIDSLLTPVQSVAAIAGIFLMLMGVAISILWFSVAAPLFLSIITESAEGHDRLYQPPEWSALDWLTEAFYLIVAGAVASAPGMLAWSLGAPLPQEALLALGAGVAIALFPLLLLGAVFENTPFGLFSPRLFGTLFRCPGPWLLFYVEVALLAAAVAAAGAAMYHAGPPTLFAFPLVVMGAAIVLMRLMGRLAWWLSDSMPAEEEPEPVDDAAAAHPHLAAARAAEREAAAQQAAPLGVRK